MQFGITALILAFAGQSLGAPTQDENHLQVAGTKLPPGTPVPYPGFLGPPNCDDINEFVRCALRTPFTAAYCSVLPGYSTCLAYCGGCCNGRDDPGCASGI
ncbi:hypothetical protein FLONG3_8807 [Fusarium longipes]|uniref:ShKT domain-containing protein n=1 Tax=Fusarium longipes TaxID=694270 RepID=A0A395S2M0_9HYPO|nr:hypothetical protein FLONG3_8807 [Fusarium longipes]